tara:strand:- start:549 stop:1187 length:639 start_codon:yes stop_codon:yes gene_type:complete
MKKRGGQVKDIIGQKFIKLLVLEYVGIKNHKAVWKCKCDCGTIKNFAGQDLRSGNTNSCGCYMKEQTKKANTKHKGTKDRKPTGTYKSWCNMKARCYQKTHIDYERYGGRGIEVCEKWRNSFENFLEDMGERLEGYSIERKDPNKNYEPSNCCWIPFNQQARNKRTTVWVILNGVEMIQKDAAKLLNKNPTIIYEWRKYPHRIPKDLDIIFP